MVCAETSKRLARSSTITRPKARAMLRISVWRWDSPATSGTPEKVWHKVAVMVRLIGAGVNEADRPQGASAGRNRILAKGGRAGYGNPHFLRCSTKQQV